MLDARFVVAQRVQRAQQFSEKSLRRVFLRNFESVQRPRRRVHQVPNDFLVVAHASDVRRLSTRRLDHVDRVQNDFLHEKRVSKIKFYSKI